MATTEVKVLTREDLNPRDFIVDDTGNVSLLEYSTETDTALDNAQVAVLRIPGARIKKVVVRNVRTSLGSISGYKSERYSFRYHNGGGTVVLLQTATLSPLNNEARNAMATTMFEQTSEEGIVRVHAKSNNSNARFDIHIMVMYYEAN